MSSAWLTENYYRILAFRQLPRVGENNISTHLAGETMGPMGAMARESF